MFLGGGFGAVCRVLLGQAALHAWPGALMPWGTLGVNLLGSLLVGIIAGALAGGWSLSHHGRLIIISGFLGGFTTFSACMLESLNLMQTGQWSAALLNSLGSVLAGLLLVFAGFALGKALSSVWA
ncbi:MAG: CrcB family protein [Vampirovibrionales bacterium]|nr:CrcB family protein [Vampirovibrionales bacterium]